MDGLSGSGRGHLAMLVFSALVAGAFSLGALAAPHISPLALTVVRFAIAGALVGAGAFARRGLSRRLWAAPWRHAVLGALLSGYFVMMFWGLQTASAVTTAAIFTLTPAMAAGFGWVLLGQTASGRAMAALAIGAAGALWVIFRGDPAALAAFQIGRGEVIYFAGCIAYAVYTPMARRLNRGEAALPFTFATLLAGFLWLLVLGWRDVLATDWAGLPAVVWVCLLYVALAASAASFVLLQYATLRLPAAKVLAYTYLVPSWVILWEIALGRPAPPWILLGGVALTILALALLMQNDGAK